MLDSYDNDKFKFYAKKLERLCSTFHFIRRPTSRFKRYKSLFSLLKFKNKEFNNVFLASVDKRSIHIILTKIKFNELYTFDDGSANLDKNSALYKDPPVFSNLRFMNIILGNKFNTKKIKKISKKHYSIYPSKENIIENVEYIPLLRLNNKYCEKRKTIKILLGQPLFNNRDKDIQLVRKIIKNFKIDYYYPHPREDNKINGISYIESPLVFEDFYIEQSSKNNIEIYTFFSSAVLNIANKETIEHIYSLKPAELDESYLESYDVFGNFGIKIIEI